MIAPRRRQTEQDDTKAEARLSLGKWIVGGILGFLALYFFAPYVRLAEKKVEDQTIKCDSVVTLGKEYAERTSDADKMEQNRLNFTIASAKIDPNLAPNLKEAVLAVTRNINVPIVANVDRFKEVRDACQLSYLNALLFELRR